MVEFCSSLVCLQPNRIPLSHIAPRYHDVQYVRSGSISGSLSNNDGDGFKLYLTYSISFTSANLGKCFWSWILKDCIKVQGKKRKLLSCVPVLDKTWIQAFSRCSRATTAKKCTKKAWCTCKVVVLLIKPIAFLPFSLPSASSLLKLPIILGLMNRFNFFPFRFGYDNVW